MARKPTYEELEQRVNELEEKAAAQEMAEETPPGSKEQYRTVIQAISAAVVVHGSDTQIVACNKMAEELLGLSEDQMLGKVVIDSGWNFLREDGSIMPFQEYPVNQVLTRRKPLRDFVAGIRRPNKNGTMWVLVGARPLVDQDGNVNQVIVTFMDITDLKRSEDALRESEQKFRQLAENINEVFYVNDATKSRMIYVSPTYEEVWGRTCTSLYEEPLSFLEAIHPEDLDRVVATFEKQRSGEPTEVGYRIVRPDGSVRQIYSRAYPVSNELGELQRIVGVAEDITNRKRAEEALRESEERFRAMFEHMGSGVAVYEAVDNGEDFIFKDFNSSAERITRIPRDEALGSRLLDLFPHMDKSGLLGVLHRVWKTGQDEHIPPFYYKDETRDGWRENLIYKLPSGEVVALFDDVTERMEAEKGLRESAERLNTIMDSMQTGIIAVDTETHKISAVNLVAAEMVNAPKEHIIGSVCHKYVCPAEKGECPIMDLGQKIDKSERILLTAQGNEIPIIKTVGRIMLDGKEHLLESFIDITEKRKLEVQLMQAQKMEAIGTLAGGIAHDFNNLLMAAQGNLSLMLYDIDSTHPHYEPLKNIEKQIKSGATLTSQLLGYARKGQYHVRPISLNELVEETANAFGRTRKETTIHRELADDLFAIEADQGQIEQVLLNLYVNATDAMPGGGDLTLKTMNVIHKDMKDKMFDPKPGNYVLLTVTDTGAGMDKEMQGRIFDPFFTTKEMGRGTGLGLASAYGIIKSHGGYIDVDSDEGKGTTFIIYLPVTEKKMEKIVTVDEGILMGTETILVVDDEYMVLDAAVKILERLGYTVMEAKSGREAVEIYEANKNKIDMVLLDMIMPDIGGGKAYDRMKEINPKVKVLLSSGYSIDGEAKEILARGCSGFIQKPFDMKRLSQAVRGTLENQ